jgi:hypothetical protein
MRTPRFCAHRFSALTLFLLIPISPAGAAVVALPSTGTDSGGNLLAGGSADPHYSVIGPGKPSGGPAVVYSPSSIWFQWLPDDARSGWIGWQDSFSTSPYGNYTYELSFNMTGYNPATASLSGSWAADQFASINLNGSFTGVSVPDGNWNAGSFPNLNPFVISSGFHGGINTLDFIVNEPDEGDGLRVRNLSLTSDLSAGIAGDYNNNGVVDAADYVVWRKNDGSTNTLPNDLIGGTIGTAQYNQWRTHFGQTTGSGSGARANAAVPEPATLVLLLVATAGALIRRRPTVPQASKLVDP